MEQLLEEDDPLGAPLRDSILTEEDEIPSFASTSFEKIFECPNCGKSFAYKKRFIMHLEQCAEMEVAKQFPNAKKKSASVSSKEKTCEFKCPMCDKVFIQKADLNRHLTSHEQDKPYECIECGRRFSKKDYLIRHIPTHSYEKMYTCPICNYQVSRPDRYKLHMSSHGVSNPFKCSLCGEMFSGLKGLNKHLHNHNSGALDPGATTSFYQDGPSNYHCVECGITFDEAPKYKYHMLRHGVEEPYECSLCGDSFSNKLHLNRHLSNHNNILQTKKTERDRITEVDEAIKLSVKKNIKSFKKYSGNSQTSNKSKTGSRDFNSHLGNLDRMNLDYGGSSSHTDTSQMILSEPVYAKKDMSLDNEFQVSNKEMALDNEFLVSNNEMALSSGITVSDKNKVSDTDESQSPKLFCRMCQLHFSTKEETLAHMKVKHNKSFACEKCGKSYTRKSNLNKHPCGDRNSQNSFECTTCGISFTSSKELDAHIISHISGEPEPSLSNNENEVSDVDMSYLSSKGTSPHINTDPSLMQDIPKKKKFKYKFKDLSKVGNGNSHQRTKILVDDQITSYVEKGNDLDAPLVKKKKKFKQHIPSDLEVGDKVPFRKIKPKPLSPLQVVDMLENEQTKFQGSISILSADRLAQEKSASEYERLVMCEFMTMIPVLPEVDDSIEDIVYDVVQVNDQLSLKFFK